MTEISETESKKSIFTPEVVPLTRHVLVDRKVINETLTAAEIGMVFKKINFARIIGAR